MSDLCNCPSDVDRGVGPAWSNVSASRIESVKSRFCAALPFRFRAQSREAGRAVEARGTPDSQAPGRERISNGYKGRGRRCMSITQQDGWNRSQNPDGECRRRRSAARPSQMHRQPE